MKKYQVFWNDTFWGDTWAVSSKEAIQTLAGLWAFDENGEYNTNWKAYPINLPGIW